LYVRLSDCPVPDPKLRIERTGIASRILAGRKPMT